MDIKQAVEALRNLGVSLNDYDTEALSTVCDFVDKVLKAKSAAKIDAAWLRQRLENPELDIYTVVRLARRDLQEGRVEQAVSRLRMDADKLRTHDKELATALLQ